METVGCCFLLSEQKIAEQHFLSRRVHKDMGLMHLL